MLAACALATFGLADQRPSAQVRSDDVCEEVWVTVLGHGPIGDGDCIPTCCAVFCDTDIGFHDAPTLDVSTEVCVPSPVGGGARMNGRPA